jgi:hypothetical protein
MQDISLKNRRLTGESQNRLRQDDSTALMHKRALINASRLVMDRKGKKVATDQKKGAKGRSGSKVKERELRSLRLLDHGH